MMKLSISNIAWSAEYDAGMYEFLRAHNFAGLEIAPTRIFTDAPYDNPARAKTFAQNLSEEYGLKISSVQSIWYGVAESVFGSGADRHANFETGTIDRETLAAVVRAAGAPVVCETPLDGLAGDIAWLTGQL